MGELKILLVEDEVLIAMLLERQLSELGLQISEHVTTGPNALLSVQKDQPDLILMDIRLCGSMDGIETAGLIHSQVSPGIPVIFLTSYDDDATRKRAEGVNPLGYFGKPLDLEKFKYLMDATDFSDVRC
ncbi:MAG: hypothetical protein A2Z96_05015 [Spirochaetes bacterium GWB1_48_6]|nr:MAG: hypothetical protein A2Z96_05015 [Spirochaetes bacterium GWB1_48_6]